MKKKPIATIRLTLPAGKATPSPILGQALGQYGINIMEFCKTFNNQTKNLKENIYIPTTITVYKRPPIEIKIKTPSTSSLLKRAAEITKGSSIPKLGNLAKKYILLQEIYHLAHLKKFDGLAGHQRSKAICKSLIGSARSMGLGVAFGNTPRQKDA